MADQRALYTEEAVGAGHPTKDDVINRLALVAHDTDGTHRSGNRYDSPKINEDVAVTATATQLNAKANSEAFVNNADGGPNVSNTEFSLSAIGEEWESVGPTGGGATNTWTALDSVPADVDWIEVSLYISGTQDPDGWGSLTIYGRKNGSSIEASENAFIGVLSGDARAANSLGMQNAGVKIPVSLRKFDLYLVTSFASHNSWIHLTGFGYNP